MPPAARTAPAAEALASLVDSIARADFGLRALNGLNRALPVAWWSVFRVFGDRPPALCALGSFEVPDISMECFRVYQTGPYRHDTAMLQAQGPASDASAGQAVLAHCLADDFGTVHREQIYHRHSLSERLSVISRAPGRADAPDGCAAGGTLAINLYRHRAQPRFSALEIDTVFELAAPLTAVVRRHLELLPPNGLGGDRLDDLPAAQTGQAPPAGSLRLHCPALTERELQVCERMLRGWSFDGIATDLALSATTVKTYRNRAFERLGIHSRHQLFALVLEASRRTAMPGRPPEAGSVRASRARHDSTAS